MSRSRKKLEKAGAKFDAIYVAENSTPLHNFHTSGSCDRTDVPVGSYKPSLNNFNYMLEHIKTDLGIQKDEILITANSILHDVEP